MSGLGTKLLAWFIRPQREKRGGQVAPPNPPVLKTSREIPLPPVRSASGRSAELTRIAAELHSEANRQLELVRQCRASESCLVEAVAHAAVADALSRISGRLWGVN